MSPDSLTPKEARGPRVGGSDTDTPTRCLGRVLSCRAGQLPLFSQKGGELPGTQPRVRLQRAPGIWGSEATHSKEILWGCQGESAPQPGNPKGSPQPKLGSGGVLQIHPHLHTPIGRAKRTRFLAPNSGSHPCSPSRRAGCEWPGSARTPGRTALVTTLPPPRPTSQALTSRQSVRRAPRTPQEQSEEQGDPAESRGGRPGRWHRGCGGRRVSGCGAG